MKEINKKNNNIISEYNSKYETLPELYIIIDNINNEKDYDIWINILSNKYNLYNDKNNLKIKFIGICNIDTEFCSNLFIAEKDKSFSDRSFIVEYLNSNYDYIEGQSNDDLKNFFKDLFDNKNIFILEEFIILFQFKEYLNEYDIINCKFLFKYIIYLNLKIIKDLDDIIYIKAISFKNEEIEKQFRDNYKDLCLHFLNNEKSINEIFGDKNGDFFEKQLIFDILTEKICNNKILNFKELKIKTIYCMNTEKIDLTNFKDSNIFFFQISKTAEIYDFAFAKDDFIKSYQVSNKKLISDLKKLEKGVIGIDFSNIKHALKPIKEYTKFSFGIITSKRVYDEYKRKENNDYYLMKNHCLQNQYEFLIYDLKERQFYIEDENNSLQLFNDFYSFNNKYQINTPELNSIFHLNPIKMTIKKFKRDIFENIENKNSIEIVGSFKYKDEFLNLEVNESNYGIFIFGEKIVPSDVIVKNNLIELDENKDKEKKAKNEKNKNKKGKKNKKDKKDKQNEKEKEEEKEIHEEIIKFKNTTKNNCTPECKDSDTIKNIKLISPNVILFKTSGDIEEIKFLQKKRK